jgi:hypothetical protein
MYQMLAGLILQLFALCFAFPNSKTREKKPQKKKKRRKSKREKWHPSVLSSIRASLAIMCYKKEI